ncbi:MAG: acetyl/propionyl/methylcrotonyl-CoA carboxylase subunit alpha [Acidimicrobiales bacterium]
MFDSVLIANRGEIAVRIIRTLRRLGVRSVAVFSDADAGARHVVEADTALRIGPPPARDSYLSVERVLEAASASGAQAIHPGYGFLSENARFAAACAAAGIVFVGPPPVAIEAMGDKIRAKRTVSLAGVPVVAGVGEPGMSDRDLIHAAGRVGFPLLVKPSGGGGGKGMHIVVSPDGLEEAIGRARREASSAFGDDTLLLERYLTDPRHIEVQVLADSAGNTLHLGERECSLQRRHQKIIEEAPSTLLDERTRRSIGASACQAAKAVGYTGAGTVEFIVSSEDPDAFYFMEMNTRLQVEHPVTEAVTGLDLVEQQLRVAAGESLGFSQSDVRIDGHAIEARVYAEDPARGFLPTGGTTLLVREPHGDGIRVDSSLLEGGEVATAYDPMLAKVIAWGPDRGTALARLERALSATTILGVTTNVAFLRSLCRHPDVRSGQLDTGLIERHLGDLTRREVPVGVIGAYGLLRLEAAWDTFETPHGPGTSDLWNAPTGWRHAHRRPLRYTVSVGGAPPVTVEVSGTVHSARVKVTGGSALNETWESHARLVNAGACQVMELDGSTFHVNGLRDGSTWWVDLDGEAWPVYAVLPEGRAGGHSAGGHDILSPMPGTVLSVKVRSGDTVTAGDAVVVVEAMKMEHTLTAGADGIIELHVAVGDKVSLGQLVARTVTEMLRGGTDEAER